MSNPKEIVIRLPGGRRVDASVGAHLVRTDQPRDNGGQDAAPSPFDLFLASLGTCAGIFIQGFCAGREIPYQDIVIRETVDFDAQGTLRTVRLNIEVPPSFPQHYRLGSRTAPSGTAVGCRASHAWHRCRPSPRRPHR
jgi:ribosomal protein S12 methylthiotransferase accessory factor